MAQIEQAVTSRAGGFRSNAALLIQRQSAAQPLKRVPQSPCRAMLMDTALFKQDAAKLINSSMVVAAVSACGLAIRVDNPVAQMALLSACLFVIGVANAVYNISNVSLRQKLTPPELLGQMTAAMRFVSWGTIPLGALLGGAMGERVGFFSTLLFVGVAGLLMALVGLLRGSLNRVIMASTVAGQ